MTRIPVVGSSRIAAYAWEPGPRPADEDGKVVRGARTGLLQIEFPDGARWYYFGVPESVFESWLMARSRGSFFNEHIQWSYPHKHANEVERVQSGG